MTQEIIIYEECVFCYAIIQFQGQGHRCPCEEAGSAKKEPTPEFLEFLRKIRSPFVKKCFKTVI